MQVTPDLRLMLALRRDDAGEPVILGYHTPISRDIFEASYRILAATKSAIFAKGATFAADVGPQIAALRLRDEARADAQERGDLDAEGKPRDVMAQALLADLKRLTMVLAPTANGWENIPVDRAIQTGVIDAEDWREAESALVFFTCAYAMASRSTRAAMASAAAGVLSASITSLSITEFTNSLATSTQAANTQSIAEVQKPTSSIPC